MFRLEQQPDGRWHWSCMQSAYGLASGTADTLPQAKIELAIAEAELLEKPFPPTVVEAMRADPVRFAVDWQDPPYV